MSRDRLAALAERFGGINDPQFREVVIKQLAVRADACWRYFEAEGIPARPGWGLAEGAREMAHVIQRARARGMSPSAWVRWLIDVEAELQNVAFPLHEWVGERKARELKRHIHGVAEESDPLDDGSCPWCGPEGWSHP
jgi:hypothetical protein